MGPFAERVRRMRLVVTAGLAVALLSACGGGGEDVSPPPSGPSAGGANVAATDAPAGPAMELGNRPDEKKHYGEVITPEVRRKALGLPANATIPADAHVKGMFGELFSLPVIPVHAVLTSDGRVLHYGTDTTGRQTANFNYAVWNPVDGSSDTLANVTGTDIFCSSQVLLPGGDQVFIAGGDNWTGTATTNTGNNNSNLFWVGSSTLTRQNNMNRARWYSTSITLLNGETYIQGGSSGGDRPEVRSTTGSFRLLSNTNTSSLAVYFPRNFIAPDGRVFGYDSAGRMYYVDPGASGGTGSIAMAGQFTSSVTGDDATAAMFAPGRILQVGGASAGAIVIDINGALPAVSTTASLQRAAQARHRDGPAQRARPGHRRQLGVEPAHQREQRRRDLEPHHRHLDRGRHAERCRACTTARPAAARRDRAGGRRRRARAPTTTATARSTTRRTCSLATRHWPRGR